MEWSEVKWSGVECVSARMNACALASSKSMCFGDGR